MNHKACAEFLGVSVRTVRYWEAGRCRVPWSAVRLLRLTRLGDLGALHDGWAGWTMNRNGLWSPDGKHYPEPMMRRWWITCEQARFWREAYDLATAGGVGATPPRARERVTLLPGVGKAAEQADAAPSVPTGAAVTPTAFACPPRQAAGASRAGMAVGFSSRTARHEVAAAARSDAGLVIFSTSGTRLARTRMAQGLRRVGHGC